MTERPCNLSYGERWVLIDLHSRVVVRTYTDLMCDVEIETWRQRGVEHIRLLHQIRLEDGWITKQHYELEARDAKSDMHQPL